MNEKKYPFTNNRHFSKPLYIIDETSGEVLLVGFVNVKQVVSSIKRRSLEEPHRFFSKSSLYRLMMSFVESKELDALPKPTSTRTAKALEKALKEVLGPALLKGICYALDDDAKLHSSEGAILDLFSGGSTIIASPPYLHREQGTKELPIYQRQQLPMSTQGGDRRSKFHWTQADYNKLRRITSQVLELWQFILEYFRRNLYDSKCFVTVKMTDRFKELIGKYPHPSDALLISVKDCRSNGGDKYLPLAFALQHAWEIMGNGKSYQYSSLKKKHDLGVKPRNSSTKKLQKRKPPTRKQASA